MSSQFQPSGNLAIIGGTGMEQLPPEIFAEPVSVETPFGTTTLLSVSHNYVEPYKLYFLSRHGDTHGIAPHQIDYHTNTAALLELGVRYVFATNAVGSLRLDLPPGSLVLLDDFIDFTRHRPFTYFDNAPSLANQPTAWKHSDFSKPYSGLLREAIKQAAQAMQVPLVETGTYLCCDGPRFESPAEIRLFRQWGADVVGMTGIPEAIFAKEAALEYAALAIVTNFGAGLTPEPVQHEAVVETMQASINLVRELLLLAGAYLFDPNL